MGKKEKIQLVLIVVIVVVTALFLWLRDGEGEKDDRVWISRPEKGTKSQTIALTLGEREEIWDLAVEARSKTPEETEKAFADTIALLSGMFGIENGEAAVLTQSVLLPQHMEETGADIRWDSSEDSVLSDTGELRRDRITERCKIELRAQIYYAQEEREYRFTVEIPPYEEGSPELLFGGAQEDLLRLEDETSGEDGFYLPETIGTVTVGLPEQENSVLGWMVMIVLFLPFGIIIGKRQEREKERKQRTDALLAAYPQLITKLTLYTGAGLSLRGAWERLGTEYREKTGQSKRDIVAGEVLMLVGELKNGTPEARAYEAFGRRIALKPYLRCAALLISQLEKGSGGLRKGLENEVRLAWELHREHVTKKGEEAQTKMLLPMMGMLFLVMAVVMVPAFFSM